MRRRPSSPGTDDDDRHVPSAAPGDVLSLGDLDLAMPSAAAAPVASRDPLPSPLQPPMRLHARKTSRDVGARIPASLGWSRTSSATSVSASSSPERDAGGLRGASKESAGREGTRERRPQDVRLFNPWRCSFLTILTSISSILLLLTIMYSFVNLQKDPKGCAMSYMRPMFSHLADFDTEHTRFASKYSLYLYREGVIDEDIRVKGVPVLFIPGNAGSYKQVRPIAAQAAVHFHDVLREDGAAIVDGKRPLDFFTVDFNEELTAFHGQTLLDQAEYLNEAIAYILALYHNPVRSAREPGLLDPKSVMILGHSMGGVVARTMLHMPNYQEHTINTIVTLSAPHARPPVSFDAAMVETYNDINSFWRRSYLSNVSAHNPLADVVLVSVAGGGLDTMIPSEYTSLTSLVPDTHGFTVFTSSIPKVWTGMDHLAIMWCDQLRKALIRAMYDVVDARRSSQTRPRPERIRAFRKQLLTGMEPVVEKQSPTDGATTFALDRHSTAVTLHDERVVLRNLGHGQTQKIHLMPIPLASGHAPDTKFSLLTDQVLRGENENSALSVLLCKALAPPAAAAPHTHSSLLDFWTDSTGMLQLACKDVAPDVALLPASTADSHNAFDDATPFSYVQYDLAQIAHHQFIAVIEHAVDQPSGWVIAEFSTKAESTHTVSKGHQQLLISGLQLSLPADRPMMTEIKIPEIHSSLFAYRFAVTRHTCSQGEEAFMPLMRQYIAEPYESKFFVNVQGGNINVHGISPYTPPHVRGIATDGLSLQFWTDPTCAAPVDVSLKVDLLGSAGKLVMRYRTFFAAFPLLVVALVLRKQFKVYDSTGIFMSFTQSMDQCIRTSLPAIFIALTFFAVAITKSRNNIWHHELFRRPKSLGLTIDFTVNDLMLGTPDPLFWFLVPLFAIISVGVSIAVNYVILILTYTLALASARLYSWLPSAATRSPLPTPFALNHRIITTGILVLMVVTIIPYQFAYLVLCIVQVATCVQALGTARASQSPHHYNFYNYSHSMLVLMLWILPINMPVLVVWIHNLAVNWLTPFSTHHNLLAVLGYIALVEMMSTKRMVPRVTGRIRHVTNTLMFALAIYAAVYGVTYAYRMHYLVNTLCLWLFLLHLADRSYTSAASSHPSLTAQGVAPLTADHQFSPTRASLTRMAPADARDHTVAKGVPADATCAKKRP